MVKEGESKMSKPKYTYALRVIDCDFVYDEDHRIIEFTNKKGAKWRRNKMENPQAIVIVRLTELKE